MCNNCETEPSNASKIETLKVNLVDTDIRKSRITLGLYVVACLFGWLVYLIGWGIAADGCNKNLADFYWSLDSNQCGTLLLVNGGAPLALQLISIVIILYNKCKFTMELPHNHKYTGPGSLFMASMIIACVAQLWLLVGSLTFIPLWGSLRMGLVRAPPNQADIQTCADKAACCAQTGNYAPGVTLPSSNIIVIDALAYPSCPPSSCTGWSQSACEAYLSSLDSFLIVYVFFVQMFFNVVVLVMSAVLLHGQTRCCGTGCCCGDGCCGPCDAYDASFLVGAGGGAPPMPRQTSRQTSGPKKGGFLSNMFGQGTQSVEIQGESPRPSPREGNTTNGAAAPPSRFGFGGAAKPPPRPPVPPRPQTGGMPPPVASQKAAPRPPSSAAATSSWRKPPPAASSGAAYGGGSKPPMPKQNSRDGGMTLAERMARLNANAN